MIFLGDIACPYDKVDEFTNAVLKVDAFRDEVIVLNLEANILEEADEKRPLTLYNAPKVLNGFSGCKKVVVSLANNHMYDYPSMILPTKKSLENQEVGVFGLAEEDGTIKPYELEVDGIKMAFFGHCWRLYTHSNRNTENVVRISDAYYDEFADLVIAYVKNNPKTKVYCFMHWNYDLEKLVMPMHIKLSRHLIDSGVEAVIGSHSHRPQGAEIYKGKSIAYGLGNFYLPSGHFFDGNLRYPECSQETYALRLDNNGASLLWFDTDKNGKTVELKEVIDFDDDRIAELSPFRNMNENDYRVFFMNNRSKKTFVPVFDEFKGKSYKRKEWFALNRVKVIRAILKLLNR